jgi:hypothetical protein
MIEERRVRFLADFDFKPKPQVTICYKKGEVRLVHLACAAQAVASKKAEYTKFEAPPAGISATLARRVGKKTNGH